jgi:hypothetical protein
MEKWAVVVIPLLALGACSSEPYDPDNEFEAEAQCESFVEDRLKSPSTAEFDLSASPAGSGWLVTGTVDSQNGFGAMIRGSVRCELHFEGDTARLDDISIG